MILKREAATASFRETGRGSGEFEVFAIHPETGHWFPVAYYDNWTEADAHAKAIRAGLFFGRTDWTPQ